MNRTKVLALFAATTATTIYGLNHTIAKMIMPIYIGSLGLVLLRVLGATAIFWTLSLFIKSKPIEISSYLSSSDSSSIDFLFFIESGDSSYVNQNNNPFV